MFFEGQYISAERQAQILARTGKGERMEGEDSVIVDEYGKGFGCGYEGFSRISAEAEKAWRKRRENGRTEERKTAAAQTAAPAPEAGTVSPAAAAGQDKTAEMRDRASASKERPARLRKNLQNRGHKTEWTNLIGEVCNDSGGDAEKLRSLRFQKEERAPLRQTAPDKSMWISRAGLEMA